jgi:hypothetical protein
MNTSLVSSKNYRVSFDFSIAKRLIAVILISFAVGLIFSTQSVNEKIPSKQELVEINNVTVRRSTGKDQGLIFQGMQVANTKDQQFSWFVSKYDFNKGLQVDLIVDSLSKKNQSIPISIDVFDENAVKKVWSVRFGNVELMSYERAKETFEIDARLSRNFRYFALLLLGLALVVIIRIEKIAITGDKNE